MQAHNAQADVQLTQAQLRAALTAALRAKQLLLEAGADTQRVEETMQRIGVALGAAAMEVYVTPTGIIASALSGPEHPTRIVRVRTTGVELSGIDAINRLSRRVAPGGIGTVTALIRLRDGATRRTH